MNKFNFKLLALLFVLLSSFLLLGYPKEKAPPTMTQEEKLEIIDSFSYEFKTTVIFNSQTISIDELENRSNEYYDAEKFIVGVDNKFENFEETRFYEIFCNYDKKLKKWQYTGSQCLGVKEKLDILGIWEFEIFPGFFQKGYTGQMHIVEIDDNKAKIFVIAENDKEFLWGEEHWYDIHPIDEDKHISEREYTIRDIIAIDYEDKRYKNIIYNMNITVLDAEAYNQNYYQRSKMKRIDTGYKTDALYKEYEYLFPK